MGCFISLVVLKAKDLVSISLHVSYAFVCTSFDWVSKILGGVKE